MPVLLAGILGDPERPWDTQELRDPDDLTELADLDAAELLREDWLRVQLAIASSLASGPLAPGAIADSEVRALYG